MKVQHVLFSALCAFTLLLLLQACIPPRPHPDPGPVTDATYWSLSGNAGTTDGTEFMGTTDNKPLNLRVNNTRALRLEPHATSPNVVGGYSGNNVTGSIYGATISGGGDINHVNQVTAQYGTVGGGRSNTASGIFATIGGGTGNIASGVDATVGGGTSNRASGYSTVGGGNVNIANGQYATVPGGYWNTAAGDFSFAAGRKAKANHEGTFVWADNHNADFASTAANQFLIRASGGVGIGTTNPGAKLEVDGDLKVTGAYRGNIGPNNGAPFPRPAYDSGWRDIDPYGTQPLNGNIDLTHNLGGDPDNYVVDLGFISESGYRGQSVKYSVWNIGEKRNRMFGAFWYSLTDTKISVWRERDDYVAAKVRVRIWVYN